ncbi:hypothetical protein LZ016_01475 [Sphingomonas sp. SM33]|uniref:DUF2029 domain-containing protein n=1 Tax=Sphingomonas telluris TaxID=2907998 RepID=A0ABS9VJV2_9SPHN|nr:hypothetical protein [Sphingomonas telluris]MCH8614779.1 hypothetical protein [Sphingomonas telluris]
MEKYDRVLLTLCCCALWALQMLRPLTPDVAWYLDAGSRWFNGQRLYVDILELNPPLIFYDMALLTAGTWSKGLYLAGVCAAIFVSAILCERRWAAFAALTLPALLPFGQRDHLALIAVLPYLASDRRGWPMGIWLFAGTALKPHFLLMPLLAALWRRRWDAALTTLLVLVALYAVLIPLIHPAFLTDIVPLARSTYHGLGGSFGYWYQLGLILAVLVMNRRSPIAGAILGALLAYLLQGKFWYYQLVPALGLATYGGLVARRMPGVNRACAAGISILSVAYLAGAHRPIDPIPAGATRVLFATPHIPMAYPVVFERGVENTSPYPALWPVPGAATRPDIVAEVRHRQVDAILKRCPQYIFTNMKDEFDYFAFLSADPRLHGYRRVGNVHSFRVYLNPRCA